MSSVRKHRKNCVKKKPGARRRKRMATKQKQTEDKKVKYRTEEKDKKKKKHKHELLSLAHGGRRRVYYLSVAEKLSGRPKKNLFQMSLFSLLLQRSLLQLNLQCPLTRGFSGTKTRVPQNPPSPIDFRRTGKKG